MFNYMSREKNIVVDEEKNSATNFISRWSRLKHKAKHNAEYTAPADSVVVVNKADKQSEDPVKILTDDDMPDIELMTDDSDYTGFLSPGVSEALRKLFHSEVFNICDGLDEYDGDYTQFEKLGSILTADMQHQLEVEAKRKARALLRKEIQTEEMQADTKTFDEVAINDYKDNPSADEVNDDPQNNPSSSLPMITMAEEKLALNNQLSDKSDVPTSKADKVVALPNPAINLWNNVRQRQGKVDSSTQARGIDTGILISETGGDSIE